MAGFSTESHGMGDSPGVFVANTNLSLQVGSFGSNTPEKFITYVMYLPGEPYGDNANVGSASWVAIGKVDWSWSGATNDGVTLQTLPTIAPAVTAPVTNPSDYFPTWTDSGTQILNRGNAFSGSPGWLPK